uniref:Putative secreted protein n=1 Tax=Ixodes scapularis TaxID=6945 RepID=A0A4D5S1N9_IXOSC
MRECLTRCFPLFFFVTCLPLREAARPASSLFRAGARKEQSFFFSFLSGRGEKPSGIVEPTSSFIHYAETKGGRKKRRCMSLFLHMRTRGLYVCVSVECVFVSHVLPGMTP